MPCDQMSAPDAIGAYRLLNDCRDLGADPVAWRSHFFDGLRALVSAQVVIGAEMRGFGDPHAPPEAMGVHRLGWESERAERAWAEYAETTPMERTPEYPRLRDFEGDMVTLRRDQIWRHDDWYRSRTFNNVHRVCGIDDYVISIRRVPRLNQFTSLFLHRAVGAPAFSQRDIELVNLLHEEVGDLIGAELAAAAEPGIEPLSPRQREVLDLLLDGDAEKQIAATLGIARATVHEHVTALYRHFEVSSRAELLALFIGRARPPRVT